jgi:adenosyl cobinamide kinase/adenosyl cobinamide phosphate guanylyltransferase
MLTVLLGGARSGKSKLAVEMGMRGEQAVTYVATAPEIAGDDDLAGRISRHRAERPSEWTTIEEELDLVGALRRVTTEVAIIDCLTVWVGNMQYHGHDDDAVLAASADTLVEVAALTDGDTVVIAVSNEVGMGIVPADQATRAYRDLLGRVNQQWVAASDTALLMVAGRALPLYPPHDLLP